MRAAHLPNGCDASYFADVDESDAAADVDLEGPVAGFVGHINSRTDLGLLEAVADAGVSLLLVGPKDPSFEPARFDRLVERRNVAYVGSRPFEQLPSYLKLIDVGLVPYGLTEFNRYSFPMKTLEYLAAGRPVVATSLPAMQWLDTDLVSLADNPEAFAPAWSREARAGARSLRVFADAAISPRDTAGRSGQSTSRSSSNCPRSRGCGNRTALARAGSTSCRRGSVPSCLCCWSRVLLGARRCRSERRRRIAPRSTRPPRRTSDRVVYAAAERLWLSGRDEHWRRAGHPLTASTAS